MIVVGLRGLEPLTSSLSSRAGAARKVAERHVRAWILSIGVRLGCPVVGPVVQQLVRQPSRARTGAETGRATEPITSTLARRWPGSRVAGGHRVATRSALDAGCRRANPRGSGRRLGGEQEWLAESEVLDDLNRVAVGVGDPCDEQSSQPLVRLGQAFYAIGSQLSEGCDSVVRP